jgi:hypothetical protein
VKTKLPPLIFLFFLNLSPIYSENDIPIPIRVSASLIEVDTKSLEGLSQDALKKLVEAAASDQTNKIAELAACTQSGKWATVKSGKEIWHPTAYAEAKIFQGKEDSGTYSIPLTDSIPGTDTSILPASVTSAKSTETGFILKVKPILTGKDTISLEGEFRVTSFLGLLNENDPISVKRTVVGKQVKTTELTSNRVEKAKFHVETKSISIPRLNQKYYAPFTYSPEKELSSLTKDKSLPSYQVGAPDPTLSKTCVLVLEGSAIKSPPINPPVKLRSSPPEYQIYITSKFIEVSGETTMAEGALIDPQILTDPQFQGLIQSMNQKKGVDLLSAPSMMLRNGNPGVIEVTKEVRFPHSYEPIKHEFQVGKGGFPVTPPIPKDFVVENTGVRIDVSPTIVMDNGLIRLKVKSTIRELQGYISFANPAVVVRAKSLHKNQPIILTEGLVPLPVFSIRYTETEVLLADSFTVNQSRTLDHFVQTIEDKKPFGIGTKQSSVDMPRHLSVFLRAQIKDPSGAR